MNVLEICSQVPPPCKVKIFERGIFQGSYYCSNLKFCIRIYVLKYKTNIQELGQFDQHVMVHRLWT